MDNCCVCFNSSSNLLKINETIPKNIVSIKNQLENLVPEVTWLEDYAICPKCQDSLSLIQEFRHQCLESQKFREMEVKVEDIKIAKDSRPSSPTELLKSDCSSPPSPVKELTDSNQKPLLNNDSAVDMDRNESSNERPLMCSYCGKTFKTPTDVWRHEKIHLNKRQYECKLCNKGFNINTTLNMHNLLKHTDPKEWRFPCNQCNKRFPIRRIYNLHLQSHENNKEFKCHICDKNLKYKHSLKMHLDAHKNSREFKCDLCGSEHRFKRQLDLHQFRIHKIGNVKLPIVKKKFICEFCAKAFSVNHELQKHLRTHLVEKPLKCPLCDNRFHIERNVRRHIRRMHGESENDKK